MAAGEGSAPAVLEAAGWRAFDAYSRDLRDGGTALADLARADVSVTVTLPVPGRGWRSGRRELVDLSRWRHTEVAMIGQVTARGLTTGWTGAGQHAVAAFEFDFAGTLAGDPYDTHAAVAFTLEPDGSVSGVREYYGDNVTPPSAFADFGLEDVFLPTPGQRVQPGKPDTLARTRLEGTSRETVATGQRAFDAFALSVQRGDWDPYLDLMDPEVTFTLPIPGRMRGVQQGLDAVREYHRWRWEDLRMRAELEQQSLLVNGPTVAVEFDTVGTIGSDIPIHHWAMYYFDVRDERVVGFREYNGDEITR